MIDTEAIPNEIFAEIFSFGVDITHYLTNISLVSRRFHALVEPILYKEIVINHDHILTGMMPFVRAILSRPMLGGYVRLLDINWVYTSRATIAADSRPQDPGDLQLFTAAATRVGLLESMEFQAAQVALLLHLLPNLEVLKVHPPAAFHPWIDSDILAQILGEYAFLPTEALPAGLRSVRSVTLGPDGSHVSPEELLTLLKLPRIREIDVDLPVDMDEIRTPSLTSPGYDGTSSVTSLRFGYGTINALSLARILAMPQALTRFSYVDYGGRPGGFNCAVFLALVRFRGTLQRLELWFGDGGVLGEKEETIGSLHDWPALKNVRCQLSTLLGKGPGKAVARLMDVVPAVMTDLTIEADDCWKYVEVIGQVVEMLEGKGCNQVMNVSVGGSSEEIEESVEERLGAACGAAGVAFVGFTWRDC